MSSDMESDSNSETEIRDLNIKQNKKKKKSGGFQSMGLSHPVFKGVMKLGYKIPTPIQRKTIPEIMNGHDVVAMARTGSGKTAAFLIPMFEKLKCHSAASARALIISPTRELALQTLKFTKELGKFTGLKAAVILGGDKMDDQFAALHENPDIIIATPGRLLHVLVEMEMKLKAVEYLVFDEADRLFDQGFRNELTEILRLVSESRQTLLFSATLPKSLVEFAKAGLNNPSLIRLDVDTKLSPKLKMSFLRCRSEGKVALTLYLLQHVIPQSEQVVIFVATKHHAEYLGQLLTKAEVEHCCVYGALDQTHRKISVAKFRLRKVRVLVVTDVAARGIDLPLLENVLNFHFPPQAKLFVHRVGRVARAERSGTAYSLVAPDEIPYLVELHVFLGRPLQLALIGAPLSDESGLIGGVPQSALDDVEASLATWHRESVDMANMKRVCSNAMKQYMKSRPAASTQSLKRGRELELQETKMATHPMFGLVDDGAEKEREKVLTALKSYRPRTTIFEINSTAKKSGMSVMKEKREKHDRMIERFQEWQEGLGKKEEDSLEGRDRSQQEDTVDNEELEAVFASSKGKKRKRSDSSSAAPAKKKKKQKTSVRDEENFIPYRPSDFDSERGLQVVSFGREADGAVLDMVGDEDLSLRKARSHMKWDKKRKRFVNVIGADNKKKITTESGARIASSFKSKAYAEWKRKSMVEEQEQQEEDAEEDRQKKGKQKRGFVVMGTRNRKWHTAKRQEEEKGRQRGPGKRERRSKEQILKSRHVAAQKKSQQLRRENVNRKNQNIHQSKHRKQQQGRKRR